MAYWHHVLVGLACGLCLASFTAALWASRGQAALPWPVLVRSLYLMGWLTAGLLLAGAVAAWSGGLSVGAPGLGLAVVAALAAPLDGRLWRHPHWSSALGLLPTLLASSLALGFLAAGPSPAASVSDEASLAVYAGFLCGGLAARALGEALALLAHPGRSSGWVFASTVAATAAGGCGAAIVSMLQQPTPWPATGAERGLVVNSLVWASLWVGNHAPSRLRSVLTAVAGAAAVAIAVGLR